MKLFRDVLEVVAPGVLIVTETNVPHAENVSYFGTGDEAHMVYQFSLPPLVLHALYAGRATYLRDWAKSTARPPAGCAFFNFTASHDGIGVRPLEGLLPDDEFRLLIERVRARGGIISNRRDPDGSESPYELNCTYFDALGEEGKWGTAKHVARFLCSQTLALSLQGVPGVYVHSLTATPNDHEEAARTGHPRALNRSSWDEEELNALLDDSESVTSRVFREYVRRLQLRRTHAAFHPQGAQEVLELGEALFGVRRTAPDGSEVIVAVSNLAATAQELALSDDVLSGAAREGVYDILRGDRPRVRGGKVRLEPYACCWLRS